VTLALRRREKTGGAQEKLLAICSASGKILPLF
jgi:hypothetical protein